MFHDKYFYLQDMRFFSIHNLFTSKVHTKRNWMSADSTRVNDGMSSKYLKSGSSGRTFEMGYWTFRKIADFLV